MDSGQILQISHGTSSSMTRGDQVQSNEAGDGFFLACEDIEEGSTVPRLRFFFFFFLRGVGGGSGDQLAHSKPTFEARICPQWLSKLGRLWPSVP